MKRRGNGSTATGKHPNNVDKGEELQQNICTLTGSAVWPFVHSCDIWLFRQTATAPPSPWLQPFIDCRRAGLPSPSYGGVHPHRGGGARRREANSAHKRVSGVTAKGRPWGGGVVMGLIETRWVPACPRHLSSSSHDPPCPSQRAPPSFFFFFPDGSVRPTAAPIRMLVVRST